MSSVNRRQLVRAALAIHRQLERRRSAGDYNELPTALQHHSSCRWMSEGGQDELPTVDAGHGGLRG